jgi:ferritin-like metal-binding protein YciE
MSTQDKTMKERSETLQKYVSDMVAVEDHIANAVKRQTDHEDVYKHSPQASQVIQNIAQMTEQHAQHLKQHLESIGGDPAKGIKEVATAAMGVVAGMYDKVRTESVSKMLRDDYTALNLAAVGYTMLHTTGLALRDQATADLALRHLKHYTSIIMQINQIIPSVVVADLRDDVSMLNEASIQQATQNTQDAWKPSTDGGSYQSMGGSGTRSI